MSEEVSRPKRGSVGALPDELWRELRQFTAARVGLGRAGNSLPTRAMLEFTLAHAAARDAVHAPLDAQALTNSLREAGLGKPIQLTTRARSRAEYLLRPDLGRMLSPESGQTLATIRKQAREQAQKQEQFRAQAKSCDLAILLADGLSSLAVARNAAPLLAELLPRLADWSPRLFLAEQARVAVGDEVGALLEAQATLVLIGERPGLSSPDSLGAYLTWSPNPGRTDADRNCVSNIRPEGLGYVEAARKIAFLLHEASRQGLSGVALKDTSAVTELP